MVAENPITEHHGSMRLKKLDTLSPALFFALVGTSFGWSEATLLVAALGFCLVLSIIYIVLARKAVLEHPEPVRTPIKTFNVLSGFGGVAVAKEQPTSWVTRPDTAYDE